MKNRNGIVFDNRIVNVGDVLIHKETGDIQYVLSKRSLLDQGRTDSRISYKYKTKSAISLQENFVSSWTLSKYDIEHC